VALEREALEREVMALEKEEKEVMEMALGGTSQERVGMGAGTRVANSTP
jgi:hypothetical protein